MSTTNKLFTEIFRAKSLDMMAIPKRVRDALKNGLTQNVLLYSTSGGTGKTTITKILTNEKDEKGNKKYDVLTINASAERGIDVIREQITTFAGTYSLENASSVKVIVLEEMDGLTGDSFDALRAVIEKYADSVRFVGNCNNISKIPEPVQSRFLCIPLFAINAEETQDLKMQYKAYVKAILSHKNIGIESTDEDVSNFVELYYPNMRTILNKIQEMYCSGCKVLNTKNLESTFNCSKLYDLILSGNQNCVENYKVIVSEYADNPDEIMLSIGREFLDYVYDFKPEFRGRLWQYARKIAEYCRTLNQAIDKQVHLLGLVADLIIISSMK